MIKIEHTEVFGWEASIRGLRNPMNSWDKCDSEFNREARHYFDEDDVPCTDCRRFVIGENDLKLMKSLAKAGSDHCKFLRMINVTVDLVAPLYWWKEFDTYKVGTVANSCSTMHKIQAKEFTLDDFSHEHLITEEEILGGFMDGLYPAELYLLSTISALNHYRHLYLKTKDKKYWWQMIQLLPSSFNQRRTVQLNYEVLRAMYHARKNHKLDEWHDFCAWCETLPYFTEICIQE